MSKAKIRVKATAGKSGTLVAKVPVSVAPNKNPSGKKMYETKARTLVTIKTTRGGRSRAVAR